MTDQVTDPTDWPELLHPEKLEQILEIIAAEGGVDRDRMTPGATLETLGLQSMDVVMVLMGVEDKLDTYLPMDAELSSARNLAELVSAIDKSMKANAVATEANPS